MNIKINKFKQLPVKIHSPELSFHHKLQINLPIMNCDLALYFKTEQNEEKCIKDICFELEGNLEYQGHIDLYLQMIEGRAIEALDRVNIKEYDYFLRDDVGQKLFEFYDDYLYEIIGLGEYIINYLKPSENKPDSKILKENEIFSTLSFSEQVEYFEEFLTKYIYQHKDFHQFEINLENLEKSNMTIECPENEKLKAYLKEKLSFEFGEFSLIFR